MSIRPTNINEPIFEPEPNLTESEIKQKELKKYFILLIIFLLIDFIITIFIILHENYIFTSGEIDLIFLLINIIGFTLFYLFIIISFLLFRVCLTKTVKYLHIILTMFYLGYLLIKKIIYFVKNFENVGVLDIIFMFLVLTTIVPRILFYYFIGKYIVILMEKYECQRGEEHEDFRQNLENKMERGDNTNWSKTSLPTEPKRTSN